MLPSLNEGVFDLEEKILTKRALALIGVCDEFYDLYFSIDSILEKSYKDLKNHSHSGCVSLSQIEKYSKPQIRMLLNNFLNKYTHLFTNDFDKLHPNSKAINSLKLLEANKVGALTLEYKMVSFDAFLHEFEEFIVQIIVQRKRYDDVTVNYHSVKREILKHFTLIVNSCFDNIRVTESHKKINFEELIIFKNLSATTCNRNHHQVNSDIVIVPLLNSNEFVRLPVHKCDTCGKKFIGNETLHIYEEVFGKMIISVRKDVVSDDRYTRFTRESELHKTGYNVVEGNMLQSERRTLLIKLLEMEILTTFQICRDIENAIRIFKGEERYERAVEKWRSDLFFISEYVKENLQ